MDVQYTKARSFLSVGWRLELTQFGTRKLQHLNRLRLPCVRISRARGDEGSRMLQAGSLPRRCGSRDVEWALDGRARFGFVEG